MIADLQLTEEILLSVDEVVGDLLVDIDTMNRAARLSVVLIGVATNLASTSSGSASASTIAEPYRPFRVSCVCHASRSSHDRLPHARRTRERDVTHAGMFSDALACDFATTRKHVDDASRKARFFSQFADIERGQRVSSAGLIKMQFAGKQRWEHEPRGHTWDSSKE